MQQHGYGFKFLDPTGATYPGRHDGSDEMLYALPRPGEKWGPWMEHPRPAAPDGQACGPGRYHVMRKLSAVYAPRNWWPWFCEWSEPCGQDQEKVGVRQLRLRRISPRVLDRALRPPFNWGCQANLIGANLIGANLIGANLHGADLSGANLYEADLRGADLTGADLRGADLCRADLRGADLREADLSGADLRGADLRRADLSGALLTDEQRACAVC